MTGTSGNHEPRETGDIRKSQYIHVILNSLHDMQPLFFSFTGIAMIGTCSGIPSKWAGHNWVFCF